MEAHFERIGPWHRRKIAALKKFCSGRIFVNVGLITILRRQTLPSSFYAFFSFNGKICQVLISLWLSLTLTPRSAFLLKALKDEITSAADELICCVSSLNRVSRKIIFSANFHWQRVEHGRQVVMGPISSQDAFLCKVPPGGWSCCQKCWCCFVTATFWDSPVWTR